MARKSADPRINRLNINLSDKEMESLDDICEKYHISRPDLLRIAMYLAVHEPVSFLYARCEARDRGLLTDTVRREKKL